MIGGLPVAALDRASTAEATVRAAVSRRNLGEPCLFFTTVNGQVVSICASDREVRDLFGHADMISADGMSIVFASRLASRTRLPERVATTDAFHDIARVAEKADASFYFLGATEEISARAFARTKALYPDLRLVGRRNGYFAEAEEANVIAEINAAAPDVLWVGLGVPRQQRFIVSNRAHLTSVGVAKSCGGLFDFLAGASPRAPERMQAAGLEWLYRLWLDPRRLTWRYATTNPHAAIILALRSGAATPGIIRPKVCREAG
jgi:exopolysaccharide biosynthesis WecB/TagA/CpsF family protein